jgi:hypothetical protein
VRLALRLLSGIREYLAGTAATFEQVRDDFEAAWRVFSAKRTEADFQARRDRKLGLPRSIAATIGARASRMVGGLVPDRGWPQ